MSPNNKGKMRANLKSDEKNANLELQDDLSPNSTAATYSAPRSSVPTVANLPGTVLGRCSIRRGTEELEQSRIEGGTNHDSSPHSTNHQEDASQQASSSSLVQHPSPNTSGDRPSGSFFEGPADKVEIKGGTINHTLGNYNNVTIHVNHRHGEEHDALSQYSDSVSGLVSQLLSAKPHEGDNMPQQHSPPLLLSQTSHHSTAGPSAQGSSTTITIYSPDNSNEIYEEHLQRKKRGFPLWIPSPSRTLHTPYRRRGVDIGDVGIITSSGAFSFLFNICLPPDHPINPRTLPEGFTPIYPPIERLDICEYSAFNPGSHLASAIEKIDDPQFPGLSFVTSDIQGAVVTLPDGAIARDLENISRFRAYAAANVENWYRYVNGPRGREAKNGDIRLVYGCDKAPSWGIAAVANMTQHKTHYLKYRSIANGGATPALIPLYKWEYTGLAETKVGPEHQEIEDLKRNDDSDVEVEGKYWNQSLFIRTLNLRLNEDVFATINQEVESALIEESQRYHNKGGSGSSTTNSPSTGEQLGTSFVNQTGFNSGSLGSAMQTNNFVQGRVTIWKSPSSSKSHPADVLNKLLLQKFPNSRVVITEDENWCSVIKEDDDIMPGPSEIAERVLAAHHIRDDYGVVFLKSKKVTQPSHSEHKCKGCNNHGSVATERVPYSKGGKSYPTCGMGCARVYEQLKNSNLSIPTQSPTRSLDGASLRRIGSNHSSMRAVSALAGPSRRPAATVDDLSQDLHSLSFQNTPTRRINTSPCVVCLVGVCRDDKFVTCGIACAEVLCKTGSANPNNCNYCHRRPKAPGQDQCNAGCMNLAKMACLLCKSRPKYKRYHLCGRTCKTIATKVTPLILEAPPGHVTYEFVEQKFKDSWKFPGNPVPAVKKIFKIIEGKDFLQPYDRYKKAVSNEVFRYHGTTRRCTLGSGGNTQLCSNTACALCCVLKTSFKTCLANPNGAFGPGVYSSSASNKAYSYTAGGTGAIILTKVILGNIRVVNGWNEVISCPAGFNSVVFDRQNGSLNETIVYSDDAIRPVFLITF